MAKESNTRNSEIIQGAARSFLVMMGLFAASEMSAQAVVPLGDDQLDQVTAGRTQVRGKPASVALPSSLNEETPDSEDDIDHTVIAIGHTQTAVTIVNSVTMNEAAQSGLSAVTLSNVSKSDVANGVNIFGISSTAPLFDGDMFMGQSNSFSQSSQRQGHVAYARQGPVSARTRTQHAASSTSESSRILVRHDDVYRRDFSETQIFNVSVPKYDPFHELNVPLVLPEFEFVIPGWDPPSLITEVAGAEFGIDVDIGDTTLTFNESRIGDLLFTGEDVIFTPGSITTPTIDFPQVDLEACFFECVATSVDLGDFGGWNLPVPLPPLEFVDANPFKDLDLNIGAGIAAAGTGTFRVGGDTRISLIVDLTLEIPDIDTSFEIDILGVSFDVPGLYIPLPDIEIEIPLIDEALPHDNNGAVIEVSFTDSVFCMSLTPAPTGDCIMELSGSEDILRINNTTIEEHFENSVFESYSQSLHVEATGEIEITSADADLIAFADATASLDTYEVVVLSDGAQQGLQVVNGVNAVSAMIGNGLNFSSMNRNVGAQGRMDGQTGLSQLNTFLQVN